MRRVVLNAPDWLDAYTDYGFLINPYRWAQLAAGLRTITRSPVRTGLAYFYLPTGVLLVQLGALCVMSGLRQTLGRCRVRTTQVLRVFAYTATPIGIVWSFVLLAGYVVILDQGGVPWSSRWNAITAGTIGVAAFAYACFLRIALRDYLRLPRSTALAVAAATVGGLFAMTVLIWIRMWEIT